ncbi:MAG: SDR family NAD(P)-dependent oxidoreductase [Sulfuricurvum sp.]|jgi:short-subunit dehydrogenase|uniref:SDR family oxidoreductase n=1 Tax=Sulfuricurvum sp. TaxID=2025608 RepID=UPI0025D924FC|nr:SDR family NAD(P)-dependent oxidoreductase [Sulfuricurvum sp.]MCI4406142.1 SDR family NAD(P)-dependent oxidoreductase [Sulfuricurvum sp.]
MATAVVSGSSSGIGEAIAQVLLQNGYRVVGLSRRRGEITHPSFEHLACDLSDFGSIDSLQKQFSEIDDLEILVNAAGFGRFEPHEELSTKIITDMIALNLSAPILLANALLRPLKKSKGMIINITSIEATRHSKFSALYSATKAGLRAFGLTLFEETRNSGVKVVTINPDMTETPFFEEFRFGVGQENDTKLLTSDIAQVVQNLLDMRDGICVTELTIRSQRFGITKK